MMKIQTLTLAVAGILTIGALAASAMAQSTADAANPAASSVPTEKLGDADGAFAVARKFSEPTGEKLYKRVCAACHMADAKGAVGAGFYPSLASNPKLMAGGYPTYVVLHGMNGMPAIGTMMTDQQVADVVNYVRTHFGNKYKDKVTAADAKAVR